MDGKKQRAVVFWPLENWLEGVALVAVGLWLGPWKHVFARVWLYPVLLGAYLLVVSQVLVMGRGALWLVYPFGLHWKRIRREDIVAVIDFHARPGSPRWEKGCLSVRTADDGLYGLDTSANHRKSRLAEALREIYGVEPAPQPLPPYHQEWH